MKADGSVVTWGRANHGGDIATVASQLASGVEEFMICTADNLVHAHLGWHPSVKGGGSGEVVKSIAQYLPVCACECCIRMAYDAGKPMSFADELCSNACPDCKNKRSGTCAAHG